jgi:itaconate CoA-transferase
MKKTVLSLEQALTLPYATQRFVQLGWRVIRLETPPEKGSGRGGDPNRYIGEETGSDDLHSYFIAPNVGKESITLNLRTAEGQELLKKIIKELDVDVFLCNTLPKRYEQLGIDYKSLRAAKSDLIWCGISALGPEHPDAAGYDPALQAMFGYMYLTGDPNGYPTLCGLPIIDLKAGDEAFTQVILAMMEQEHPADMGHKGVKGKEIHISMAQCATSWLITALPQLAFVNDASKLFTRSGNEHRSFIPSNCYPTSDGYAYLAIGSDGQWAKLTQIMHFEHLQSDARKTNQGRSAEREAIYADIRKGLQQYTTAQFIEVCQQNGLAVAPVNSVQDTAKLDVVKRLMVSTEYPEGERKELFPAPAVTPYLATQGMMLKRPPHLGEHNSSICREVGLTDEEIRTLHDHEVI